jgi:S-adenosyl methyltransferase
VLAHGRALLTSNPEGAAHYIEADLHDPEEILRKAAELLDLTKPTALMLMGILGHVADFDEARSIVRKLMDGLPSGSYLVHYDSTNTDEVFNEATRIYNEESGGVPYILRSPEQLTRLYDGLQLVEPGVVMCTRWRPDPSQVGEPATVTQYGGVGRKP